MSGPAQRDGFGRPLKASRPGRGRPRSVIAGQDTTRARGRACRLDPAQCARGRCLTRPTTRGLKRRSKAPACRAVCADVSSPQRQRVLCSSSLPPPRISLPPPSLRLASGRVVWCISGHGPNCPKLKTWTPTTFRSRAPGATAPIARGRPRLGSMMGALKYISSLSSLRVARRAIDERWPAAGRISRTSRPRTISMPWAPPQKQPKAHAAGMGQQEGETRLGRKKTTKNRHTQSSTRRPQPALARRLLGRPTR